MKHLIIALFAISLLGSCTSKTEEEAKEKGIEIYFPETVIDYGEILEDSDGIYKVKFKNIAETSFVVNHVRSSCGCTIPTWPKEPIEPGKGGVIDVKYNTRLVGPFTKSVYVYSSAANSPVKLLVKGRVIAKEK